MRDTLIQEMVGNQRREGTEEVQHRRRLHHSLRRIYPWIGVEVVGEPGGDGEMMTQVMMYLTHACNQECPFCQIIGDVRPDEPTTEQVKAAAVRTTRLFPGSKIILSGGEPTVRKDIVEIVDALVALEAARSVQVQSNAVLMGRMSGRLVFEPSAKLDFLISMHALEPSLYDQCTGSRGQLELAVAGVRNLLAEGHRVELNCVACSLNQHALSSMVRRLPEVFGDRLPVLHFSVLGMAAQRDVAPFHMRFTDLVAAVREAREIAAEVGVEVRAALSARRVAIPICLLGEDFLHGSESARMYEHEEPNLARGGEASWSKGPRCDDCAATSGCFGLPRSYAERFGFHELSPLSPR